MQILKMVAVGAAVVVVGGIPNRAFSAYKNRLQLTREQIRQNGENEELQNSLPLYSEHFYIVSPSNSRRDTPPATDTCLRTNSTDSGLVSKNKTGELYRESEK